MGERVLPAPGDGPKEFEVRWEGKSLSVPAGSTFLDVKDGFGWDDGVLMVQVDCEMGRSSMELMEEIKWNCSVTPLGFESEEAREALRHTASHILAQAVKRLFPKTRLGIGPAIEDGFYYDFDTEHGFVSDDLAVIEAEMARIIKENLPVCREVMSREEARALFEQMQEPFKLEILEEIPEDEPVSIYRQGEFVDLCAGPHVPSTGYVKAYKLLSIAGAYWRGDENRMMLQRIYGTAFLNQQDLEAHLARLEDIKRRDHRKLGKDLDLFSIEEEAGPGLVFWHPKGAVIREVIEDFWRKEHRKRGYDIVYTPHIAKLDIWKTSGHWDWYKENMYSPIVVDEVQYLLKPMNCPFHILMYKTRTRSYRDLPLRWAELGTVYRYERSGVLHGMLRVRGFTQDDAHLFMRPDQLEEEIIGVIDLVKFMMEAFQYKEYEFELSVRDPNRKQEYAGSDDIWDLAENALISAMNKAGIEFRRMEGEAKFYGPAIDVHIKDALGRGWQGPTIQVDFNLPQRFGLYYIGEDNAQHQPVMIHRTVLGSMERFVAGLIEHYNGAFPVWLAPSQVRIIPIADRHIEYAKRVEKAFRDLNLRVETDARPEKVGYKIREAQLEKVPYMIIVGDKEVSEEKISVRSRSEGDLGQMAMEEFTSRILKEISERV